MVKSVIDTFPWELITCAILFGALPAGVNGRAVPATHAPRPHLESLAQNEVSDLKAAHLKGAMPTTILMVWGIFSPSYVIIGRCVILPLN